MRLSLEQIAAGLEAFGYPCRVNANCPDPGVRTISVRTFRPGEANSPVFYLVALGSQRMLLERWSEQPDGEWRPEVLIESEVLLPVLWFLQDGGFWCRVKRRKSLAILLFGGGLKNL